MKKLLSFLIVACFAIFGFTLVGCGQKDPIKSQLVTNDFAYKQIEGKEEYELVGLGEEYSQGQNMVIPSSVEGYPITKIADFAFTTSYVDEVPGSIYYYDNHDENDREKYLTSDVEIASLVIGDNVREIGKCAFANSKLVSLTIPQAVEIIGDHSFYCCEDLSTLTFEENSTLKTIEKSAFSGCYELNNVTIPSSVTEIREAAFLYNESMTTLNFEQNSKLTTIGGQAFRKTGLTGINIPNSVVQFGKYVFGDCPNLATVSLSNKLTQIPNHSFYNTPSLTTIRIPASVTYIGHSSFSNEYSYNEQNPKPSTSILTSVVFENGSRLTEIEDYAFKGVVKLESINLEACTKLVEIGSNAFYDSRSLTEIKIPATVENIGANAFACKYIEGNEAKLEKVKILTANYAGKVCSQLKTIGSAAFASLRSLKEIDLTYCTNLTTISGLAFRDCMALEEIFIPASVQKIGEGDNSVFYNTGLKKVIVGDIASYFKITFSNNIWANPLYTAKKLYTRGSYNAGTSSYNDVEVSAIDLSDSGITHLNDRILQNCESVTSIILPQTLISIGNYAFNGCRNLTSIIIPRNVETIGYSVFQSSGLIALAFEDEINDTWQLTLNTDETNTMIKTIYKVSGVAEGTHKNNLLNNNAQLFRANNLYSWSKQNAAN